MKSTFLILILIVLFFSGKTQPITSPDFSWGNTSFFNLNKGESCVFKDREIKLLQLENHFNLISVEGDTVWIKTSRRTLPTTVGGLRIYVADNKNVKALTSDAEVHGLLKKDVLIAVSDFKVPLLDENYVFPISFNDGFLWDQDLDGYLFSYLGKDEKSGENIYRSHEGIDFDLSDARGLEKHWLTAIESSSVAWIHDKSEEGNSKASCVLLKSDSQPGIFYVYDNLYSKNIEVKEGQQLVPGELIGTVWGDETTGFLQFAVVKSDTVPEYKNRYNNVVNFFPQLFQLYHGQSFPFSKNFSKGIVSFGLLSTENGNKGNTHSFEEYSGKGWQLGKWDTADKVECICDGKLGNVRLKKILFEGTKAECTNPENYYDYEINVPNGVYRIRAKFGDLKLPSWQKILFEGVEAASTELSAGEYKWTNERIVKVNDNRLTVRIFVEPNGNKVAGISEIVFQQAY